MAEVPSASGPGGAQGPVISQPSRGPRRPSMVLGGLLVLIGAILLAGQFVRVDVGHYGLGEGFVFEDHGLAELKGFDEPVRLYGVRAQAAPIGRDPKAAD